GRCRTTEGDPFWQNEPNSSRAAPTDEAASRGTPPSHSGFAFKVRSQPSFWRNDPFGKSQEFQQSSVHSESVGGSRQPPAHFGRTKPTRRRRHFGETKLTWRAAVLAKQS